MKKLVVLLFSIVLAGCGAESLTGSFKLEAAQGYVTNSHNTHVPRTYIIDTLNEKVYIEKIDGGYTDEELAAMEDMTDEEFSDFVKSIADNNPVYEEPLYDLTFLEATKDEIIIEYEGERVEFIALSDSYFKTEDGIQYVIEYDSTVEEFKNSRMNN